jgi:hypothetical protein
MRFNVLLLMYKLIWVFSLFNALAREYGAGIAQSVTGYGAGGPRGRSSSPGGVKNFLVFMPSRPALGSTQPPIQ